MNHDSYRDRVDMAHVEEERLLALLDNITDLLFITDDHGYLVYGSPSVERLLGYGPQDLAGRTLEKLVHPEDIAGTLDTLTGVLSSPGATTTFTCRVRDKGGLWHYLETTCCNLNHNPAIRGWVFTARDVTERVMATRRLEGINRCLLSLGSDHLQNIWTIVETGKDILEGDVVQYCRLDGKSLSTLSTLSGEEGFTMSDQPERHLCHDLICGKEVSPLAIENLEETHYPQSYPLIRKHGLVSYLGCAVRVEEETKGCLSLFDARRRRFTTGEVDTLRALAQALALEEERLSYEERLKDFIDIASHELRHPLTIIKGYTTSLQEYRSRLDKRKREYIIGALDKGADRLEKLVYELLDVSRIEKGRFSVSKRETSLVNLMERAVEEIKAKGANNPIDTYVSDTLDQVYADPDKLVETMVILLDNAVNYSPAGSKVVMEAADRGTEIVISVLDRGYGIPEHDRLRVFERFYQVEGARPQAVPGIGLGLYIAREIVEAHGGWIWCEPREGGGSAFHFTVPNQ
jgi:PAS domain S-box-containing protein